MSDESKPRRLWGAFRNAVVWGVTWGALGTVISALFRLSDNIPFPNWILDGIGMGIRIGVVGALTGAAFATFISLAYRGKRLADISWKKFGIGGAVLAGAFVPAWMQTLNLLSGDGFAPFSLINGDIVMAAAFGGITAAGTILLAKRDEARNPSALMEDPPTLIEAGMPSSGYAQETRSHSAATEHRE
jgi:hypothetical protein